MHRVKRSFGKFKRISTYRFFIFVLLFVALFNLLGIYILPKDTFLVFASDIDLHELVDLANQDRIARNLSPLRVDSRLISAAQQKGEDMLEKDYWSHYGPNGETPWQFIIQNGYNYVYAGENLAKDFSAAEPIHSAWMASPSHRSNILNGNFKDIGIASVTGEFQGNVTTIVVQMFGSLEEIQQESSDVPHPFIPDTEEGALEPPVITDPKDGDILDNGAFDIRGKATQGNRVYIYDNNELIGETDIDEASFDFDNKESFKDGNHHVFAQAGDDKDRKSSVSNVVSIDVDTITPRIQKESASITYAVLADGVTTYTLHIAVEDNPNIVKGYYRGDEISFYLKDTYWEGTIQEEKNDFENLLITTQDKAGHSSEVLLSENELKLLAEHTSASLVSFKSTTQSSFIGGIISRILTRSMRGRVNFFITILMLLVLVLERFMLARTGLTKRYSYSLLHLPVFAIVLFTALIGSGGEIL